MKKYTPAVRSTENGLDQNSAWQATCDTVLRSRVLWGQVPYCAYGVGLALLLCFAVLCLMCAADGNLLTR